MSTFTFGAWGCLQDVPRFPQHEYIPHEECRNRAIDVSRSLQSWVLPYRENLQLMALFSFYETIKLMDSVPRGCPTDSIFWWENLSRKCFPLLLFSSSEDCTTTTDEICMTYGGVPVGTLRYLLDIPHEWVAPECHTRTYVP